MIYKSTHSTFPLPLQEQNYLPTYTLTGEKTGKLTSPNHTQYDRHISKNWVKNKTNKSGHKSLCLLENFYTFNSFLFVGFSPGAACSHILDLQYILALTEHDTHLLQSVLQTLVYRLSSSSSSRAENIVLGLKTIYYAFYVKLNYIFLNPWILTLQKRQRETEMERERACLKPIPWILCTRTTFLCPHPIPHVSKQET